MTTARKEGCADLWFSSPLARVPNSLAVPPKTSLRQHPCSPNRETTPVSQRRTRPKKVVKGLTILNRPPPLEHLLLRLSLRRTLILLSKLQVCTPNEEGHEAVRVGEHVVGRCGAGRLGVVLPCQNQTKSRGQWRGQRKRGKGGGRTSISLMILSIDN